MNAVGIICEYNPIHNGHIYHINEVKKLYPNKPIVLILSGNFTQRGIISILDKWTKTELALEYGVDLVIELPFAFASQGADIFAKGAISLLNELKVDTLVFGSESGNIDNLIKIANIQLNNPNYPIKVKEYLNEGFNYPTALSKAIKDITNETISTPNDLLGLSYIKEIIKCKANIKAVAIKRTNDYHSQTLDSNIASASAIRKAIKNNEIIDYVVPDKVKKAIDKKYYLTDDYYSLIQYQVLVNKDKLNTFQTVDEGIENRLLEYILSSHNLEELINNIKTKRYTYNKLMRMIIHILCNFTKEEANECKEISYIRILGLNNKGIKYLNKIKKEVVLPIITSYTEIKDPILTLEYRTTCVFASILDPHEKELLIKKEFTKKPIIKEKS